MAIRLRQLIFDSQGSGEARKINEDGLKRPRQTLFLHANEVASDCTAAQRWDKVTRRCCGNIKTAIKPGLDSISM